MTGAIAQAEPLRRAALTLHALSDGDREWMLDSLAPRERQSLEPLLADLRALGIPRDPSLVPSGPADESHRRSWPEALDARELAALERVLAAEPVAVTRVLLAMQPWPWATQLLGNMDASRREAVQCPDRRRPTTARLQAAILQALQGCAAAEVAIPAARPEGPWQRVRARLAAWRGRA